MSSSTISLKPIRDVSEQMLKKIPEALKGMEFQRAVGTEIDRIDNDYFNQLQSTMHTFLLHMQQNEASDIDLGGAGTAGRIWYRVHGNKKPLQTSLALEPIETDILLHSIISTDQREELLNKRSIDFSYSLEHNGTSYRYRANMYFDLEHLALNMRKIDAEIRPFKSLNLHTEVAKALSLKYYKYGLTLVTGITGSGKSSTLDTIIDANNRTVDAHIVVIASPVELIHQPIRSVVRHREVGRDVGSFKEGAIQALRQDPDIIVIGELRDPETIMTALEITDSGHKTFGTLHTSSAMESIERILGEVPTEDINRTRSRLADVLTCVVSQKLVPSMDGKRVLAKEILLGTPSVRAAIRNNNINEIYQMLAEGGEMGMITMEQDLKRLYDSRVISKEEAYNNANNKKRLSQLLDELDY
ncbi:MAG: type IV pilus twitching motility protein PilT [Balneolaceae bacterium]